MSILAGFIQPEIGTGGRFTFQGSDISHTGLAPGTVSFVFQNPMLLGAGTGLLNILQGQIARTPNPNDPAFGLHNVRAALEKLNLQNETESFIGKKANQLSGGQAQRVAILRALSMNPQAILCDEPTSSLDETTATDAMEALKDWANKAGRPVLWVTHNLEHAGRFADHFVFVSEGRVVELNATQRDFLDTSGDIEVGRLTAEEIPEAFRGMDRLSVLRDINEQIKPKSEPKAVTEAVSLQDDTPITPGRWRFAAWIANALSYDDWLASRFEGTGQPRMAPRDLLRTLALVSGRPTQVSGLWSALLRILCYSRYSFGFVMCVLLAQIAAVEGFGRLAQTYSAALLQDPSVARIVFEYVTPRDGDPDGGPPELYGDSSIPALSASIKRRMLSKIGPETELDRVLVYGRRSISGSELRFRSDTAGCDGWIPVETVALNANDPLARQTKLDPPRGALSGDTNTLMGYVQANLTNLNDPHRIAFLDNWFVDILIERCDHPVDEPILVDWAAGQAGRLAPIKLEIRGAVAEMPPLYPSRAELLVFEHDYQQAAALQTGFVPNPFTIANAYFPIDGFHVADAMIREAGYRVRDDSAAAVETLRQMSVLAARVPPVVVWTSLVGCVILILLVTHNILELNKRVLALFIAHGSGFVDIFLSIFLHLIPALVFATIFVSVYGALGLTFLAPDIPPEIGSIWVYARDGFYASLLKIGLTTLAATGCVVWIWWARTRKLLKNYLQE